MRTRCPQCSTSFRITPEQLRVKAGKVRCGSCKAVFDAFDSLIEENTANSTPSTAPIATPPAPEPPPLQAAPPADPLPTAALTDPSPASDPDTVPPEDSVMEAEAEAAAIEIEEIQKEAEPSNETLEESAAAAREVGLMAARELNETAAYDRWSAGTLVLDSHGRIMDGTTPTRVLWPFISAAIILAIALIAQLAYHYRTELAQRIPEMQSVYSSLEIDVPLPRQSDLVRIEVSDLQADAKRGLLVLEATLKNHAAYAQAWPALELTLTDSEDSVVTRRVLQSADYLPPKADKLSFAGNHEIGLRLWIASKAPAAGYRLYVFYP